MKIYSKEEWVQLIKKELIKVPEQHSEHLDEFFSKEELIITITTKNKNRRNYTFGGPRWSAIANFSDPDYLKVFFRSPLKKPYTIDWSKVKEVSLHFLSS